MMYTSPFFQKALSLFVFIESNVLLSVLLTEGIGFRLFN